MKSIFKENEGKLIVNCYLANSNMEGYELVLTNTITKEEKYLNSDFKYKWYKNVIHIIDGEFNIKIKVDKVIEDMCGYVIQFGDWIMRCC